MSLGSVNILIKKLVKKGLVKMEKLNARSISYMLTPKGFIEKSELTYKSIVGNYRAIKEMEDKIASIFVGERINDAEIIISGEKDEVCAILESKLKSMNRQYRYIGNISELINNESDNKDNIVITWEAKNNKNEIRKFSGSGKVQFINLLDIVQNKEQKI